MQHALLFELPQENQDVLKKLREMKLGAHIDHVIDHAHSISIGRLGEKYYLMIVIDGIDFVWPRICKEHVRCLLRSANLPRRF